MVRSAPARIARTFPTFAAAAGGGLDLERRGFLKSAPSLRTTSRETPMSDPDAAMAADRHRLPCSVRR
jgi:hypothetical protein